MFNLKVYNMAEMFYKVREIKNPLKREEPGKFFARKVTIGTISTDDIAAEVAARSGHSVGQVQGLFRDYMERVSIYLAEGKNVAIKPLGTLRTTLTSSGATTVEEYDTSLIRRVNLRLKPSKVLRNSVRTKQNNGDVSLVKVNITFKEENDNPIA